MELVPTPLGRSDGMGRMDGCSEVQVELEYMERNTDNAH